MRSTKASTKSAARGCDCSLQRISEGFTVVGVRLVVVGVKAADPSEVLMTIGGEGVWPDPTH